MNILIFVVISGFVIIHIDGNSIRSAKDAINCEVLCSTGYTDSCPIYCPDYKLQQKEIPRSHPEDSAPKPPADTLQGTPHSAKNLTWIIVATIVTVGAIFLVVGIIFRYRASICKRQGPVFAGLCRFLRQPIPVVDNSPAPLALGQQELPMLNSTDGS